MKHVFFVHTPVTYLATVAVIKQLSIQKDDAVIFFQSFNEPLSSDAFYKSVIIKDFFPSGSIKKALEFLTHFNIVTRLDDLITTATEGAHFIAYIPVVSFAHKVLITHKNCVQFNFIEEGLAQYYKEETLESINADQQNKPWRTSFKNIKYILNNLYLVARGYNARLQGLPFSYSCYQAFENINFYGFSDQSFPLAETNKRCLINFDVDNFSIIKQPAAINIDNAFIWIGDPGVIQYGFSENVYLSGIEAGFISFLNQYGNSNIMIKFHREEPASLRKKILQLFQKHSISVQVLPDSIIMELLFSKGKNVTAAGIYSSLLYYASVMGHRSYSIFNYVKQEYGKAIANRDFSFFWQKVHLLD
jgi:hypothetical protein